jgi:hypothetical protein
MYTRRRFNDFAGTDYEYLCYLCKFLSTISLEKCIVLVENEVCNLYQRPVPDNPLVLSTRDQLTQIPAQNQSSNPPNAQLGELAVNTGNSETGCQKPSQNPSTTQPGELAINTWNPETEYHKSSRNPPNTRPGKRPRWLARTEKFFEEIPTTEEQWICLRKRARLLNADDILCVIDCLTSARLIDNNRSRNATTPDDLQNALVSFAEAAGSLLSDARFNVNVSNFYSLVFFATCSVALFDGHPQNRVDDALRKFLVWDRGKGKECMAEAQRLSNLRWGVVWIIQEMERQCRRGLAHRAFELFFLRK